MYARKLSHWLTMTTTRQTHREAVGKLAVICLCVWNRKWTCRSWIHCVCVCVCFVCEVCVCVVWGPIHLFFWM